jgi:hypothetical protein
MSDLNSVEHERPIRRAGCTGVLTGGRVQGATVSVGVANGRA